MDNNNNNNYKNNPFDDPNYIRFLQYQQTIRNPNFNNNPHSYVQGTPPENTQNSQSNPHS